jgi:hypothetical protein
MESSVLVETRPQKIRTPMRRIVISESIYNALTARGRFGQTFNDILTELLNPSITSKTRYVDT